MFRSQYTMTEYRPVKWRNRKAPDDRLIELALEYDANDGAESDNYVETDDSDSGHVLQKAVRCATNYDTHVGFEPEFAVLEELDEVVLRGNTSSFRVKQNVSIHCI